MKRQKAWLISGLVLLGLLAMVWAAPAQVADAKKATVAVVGEIKYLKYLNAYVVQADQPDGSWGQYLIKNPDDAVLGPLARSGAMVYVEGTLLPGSSFILNVTRIDGRGFVPKPPAVNFKPSVR
jgi:hypothetical protein